MPATPTPRQPVSRHLPLRLALFLLGLALMALGVAITTRSALGTPPISTPPYVVSLGGAISVGAATVIMNVGFVAVQLLLLRRRFPLLQLLQLPTTLVFGGFIDAALALTGWLEPQQYWARWLCVLAACLLVAAGVVLQFLARIVMNAGEGAVAALAQVTGFPVGRVKIAFDTSLVAIGAVISLVMFGAIAGIREGTLASMLLVGWLVGRILPPSRGCFERWLNGRRA